MSASLEIDDRGLRSGNPGSIILSRSRATFGFIDDPQPAKTANTNTVNINDETTRWLASVAGAFDANPLYPLILQNERDARERLNDHFITLE